MARSSDVGERQAEERSVAPVIVFLCSDGARDITGQTICIDGGAQKVR